jgi:AraC family transcriptional regulator
MKPGLEHAQISSAPDGFPPLISRSGLRVDLRRYDAGPLELRAQPEHQLMIHAGPPVRGVCATAQRYTYTRGDVDIMPAGMADRCLHDDSSVSLVVQMAPALLRRAAEELGLDPARTSLAPQHQLRDPRIEHIAWALEAERKHAHPAGALYADSLGLALALHLLRGFARPVSPRRGLSATQLKRVTSYIDDHIDRDLSLSTLASVAEVSSSHLKNAFRRSTGVPVHEFVVQRRVERAKALLFEGKLPASEIALEAGFSHQSHMARCMRRVLGVTPGALTRGTSRAASISMSSDDPSGAR